MFRVTGWLLCCGCCVQHHGRASRALRTADHGTQAPIATAGDTTLKLCLSEKAAAGDRVEMLSVSAAWLHFGRDADGSDRALLNAQPFFPMEIWPGSRSPVSATPPDRISPLKVLRSQ